MDWEKEPRLAEFAKIFESYVKDIMNVDDPDVVSGYSRNSRDSTEDIAWPHFFFAPGINPNAADIPG